MRKEKHRILAGSLNLLPPGDKIPEEDSLLLENWRVDQAGQLKTRRGMRFLSGNLPGGPCHSLYRRYPSTRYAGVGAKFYRSEGFNNYLELGEGFDGQPLGIVAYRDKTWVMNQGRQAKHDTADALKAWLPGAPGSALAAAAGAQTLKPVASFDSSEAWTVVQPDGDTSGSVRVADANGGTVTIAAGSTSVAGVGTAFEASMAGKLLQVDGDALSYTVTAVASETALTIDSPYSGTAAASAYSIYHLAPVFDFDTSNKIEGTGSLHVACYPPGTWQTRRAAALDLSLDGQQRDEDVFSIWVYASNPAAVEEVTLAIDVNTGAFDVDYYSVSIPGSQLNPAAYSWTKLEMRRRLTADSVLSADPDYVETLREYVNSNDELQRTILEQSLATLRARLTGATLAFSRAGSTAGKDWATVAAVRAQVRVSEAQDVVFDAWQVAGGLSGGLAGSYRWFVTFDTPDGHESNPSPEMASFLDVVKQPVTLSGVPVSPDSQVTKRHVYRQGGALDGIYRVGTIPDNGTTTFADALSDNDAQTRNTRMPVDHDPPPQSLGLVGPYFGKLIAYNSAAHPARYWWTNTAQPWFFPGSDHEEEGNWEDVGEEREEILALTQHSRSLWIYKERTIWRLEGDPDRSDPERTNAQIGVVGPRAVANAGSVDYFAGPEGIYRFNGQFEEKVSVKLDPLFKGEYVELASVGVFMPPVSVENLRASVLEFVNGRLYFSYAEPGYESPTVTLVLEVGTGRWSTHRLDPDASGIWTGFSALYHEGPRGALAAGVLNSLTGYAAVYELEVGETDDGANPIHCLWISRYHDQGLPGNEKVYADLEIDYRTAFGDQTPSAITVRLYYENGESVDVLGSLVSSERTTAVFRLNGGLGRSARNAAVALEGYVRSTCIIYGVYLHWYAVERWAKTFDTGVTDFGTEKVKQVDKVEFEITGEAAGTLAWAWHGDLPGGTMAERRTGTVAMAAGRRNIPVAMPAAHEGRKLRLIATSDTRFQMHAARVRVLEIGEYVDGTAGDVWESREVSLDG